MSSSIISSPAAFVTCGKCHKHGHIMLDSKAVSPDCYSKVDAVRAAQTLRGKKVITGFELGDLKASVYKSRLFGEVTEAGKSELKKVCSLIDLNGPR